ncbi:hypothetical protein [Edwardsiella ictaluri]|jgi:hypothetical protein|uniref:hypothetical protein n=1 Tax=Edwardsiella ictaluri TaxID=67780 RepID=UPI0036D29C27
MDDFISDKKINEFRDLVNSNSGFVYQTYKNKDGKNLWNLICSCMDWLTVATRHLSKAEDLDSNIDIRVMQTFSLISSIDIIFESINQLHRVFVNHKTLPFEGESSCFDNRLFTEEDDNSYFKSIRACFGAHPVNLKHSNTKRFASWPFDSHFESGELTVHLYSNKIGESDLVMHLKYSELLSFLKCRYEYLDVISEKIELAYSEFKDALSKQPIELKEDPLEQLNILKNESKFRLNNDYYNSIIDELIMIFEAPPLDNSIENLANNYRASLVPLITEIRENLQAMNISDLEKNYLLEPSSELSKTLSYEIGKFYSWLHSNQYDPLVNYYIERFNKSSNSKYKFSIEDSESSLLLKLKLMLIDQAI